MLHVDLVRAALVTSACSSGCTPSGSGPLHDEPLFEDVVDEGAPPTVALGDDAACGSVRPVPGDIAGWSQDPLPRIERALAFEKPMVHVVGLQAATAVIPVPGWSLHLVHLRGAPSPRACWVERASADTGEGEVICEGRMEGAGRLVAAVQREAEADLTDIEVATVLAPLDRAHQIYTGNDAARGCLDDVPLELRAGIGAPRRSLDDDAMPVVEWVEQIRPRDDLAMLVRVHATLHPIGAYVQREEIGAWDPR